MTDLSGNRQRLDGGALFGNVPRALWSRWHAPDERGRIELACRAFLVESEGRRVLLETGIGAFFEPRLKERYGVIEDSHRLLESLADVGLGPEDIDVVVLSHLHFDHAGGLLDAWRPEEKRELVFPRARFVVGEEAWRRARHPHPRDRASFIDELIELLERSGRLEIVPEGDDGSEILGARIRFFGSSGHTPGMRLAVLHGARQRAVFCADLVPGAAWVHLPVTMGYDRFPELLIDEKQRLYDELGPGAWLLFTHDPDIACGELARSPEGRYELAAWRSRIVRWDLDEDTSPPAPEAASRPEPEGASPAA